MSLNAKNLTNLLVMVAGDPVPEPGHPATWSSSNTIEYGSQYIAEFPSIDDLNNVYCANVTGWKFGNSAERIEHGWKVLLVGLLLIV